MLNCRPNQLSSAVHLMSVCVTSGCSGPAPLPCEPRPARPRPPHQHSRQEVRKPDNILCCTPYWQDAGNGEQAAGPALRPARRALQPAGARPQSRAQSPRQARRRRPAQAAKHKVKQEKVQPDQSCAYGLMKCNDMITISQQTQLPSVKMQI